jgi:hypothetical protein
MKTPKEIKDRIKELETEKHEYMARYKKLGQIDMLSGKGNQLRGYVDKCDGNITALKWVIGWKR